MDRIEYNERERERLRRRAWDKAHPAEKIARDRRYHANKRAFIEEVLGTICIDCGDDRPGAVEYHHPNGRNHQRASPALTSLSWYDLGEEIMNLLALCGACHKVRHYEEKTNEA